MGFANGQSTTLPRYRRIILKLSGEALRIAGSNDSISPQIVAGIASQIKEVQRLGVEVAVVVGGGNIWRGLAGSHRGMDRVTADYMGMLATVINGMALMSTLEEIGCTVRLQTAIEIHNIAEPFILRRAVRHLERGRIVIFAAGTGNPYFSTDTTAALRANEIGAQVVLKATKVDGIYEADPLVYPHAVRFAHVTYRDALSRRLAVMDSTAFSLCMDNHIPIIVFDMFETQNIYKAVMGKRIGTLVSESYDYEPPP